MSWKFGVMKEWVEKYPFADEWLYSIHEFYGDADGNYTSCTKRAIPARGETLDELRESLQRMLACCNKQVYEKDVDGKLREVEGMKYCHNCDDWAKYIGAINGPLELFQIRSGKRAHFKPFVYCPWCGAELLDKQILEDAE